MTADEMPFQQLIDRLKGDGRDVCVDSGGLFPQNARYEWRPNRLSAEAAQAIDDLRMALATLTIAYSEESNYIERSKRFAIRAAAQEHAERLLGVQENATGQQADEPAPIGREAER